MAEGKRRSDVKKFVHNTEYARLSKQHRNLFEESHFRNNYNRKCTINSEIVPAHGSAVLVRIGQDNRLEVLHGNQVIARITNSLGNDLTTSLCNSEQSGGMIAIVVSNLDKQNQFDIAFLQEDH